MKETKQFQTILNDRPNFTGIYKIVHYQFSLYLNRGKRKGEIIDENYNYAVIEKIIDDEHDIVGFFSLDHVEILPGQQPSIRHEIGICSKDNYD